MIFDIQEVDQFVVEATFRAAEQAGAAAAPGRTASVGMQRLLRGGALVHAAPDGYLIPMALLVLPQAAVGGVVGRDVPAQIDASTVAVNELTAQTIGAQVGDIVELRATDGSPQAFRVGSILPYAQIGGSELLLTPEAAARVGIVEDTQMVVWNIPSRAAFDAAVQNVGLVGRTNTKINRSWDARDPDDTLSTARAKSMMGEPWYRVVSGDTIAMHPTWMATYLTNGRGARELVDPDPRTVPSGHRQRAPGGALARSPPPGWAGTSTSATPTPTAGASTRATAATADSCHATPTRWRST